MFQLSLFRHMTNASHRLYFFFTF